MPARKSEKRPPRASRKKRLLHTFYLVQPVLQFMALAAVVFIFARCSPLAPTTDRNAGTIAASAQSQPAASNQFIEAQAQEELLAKSMKEISLDTVAVVSESEFHQVAPDVLNADQPAEDNEVANLLERRNQRLQKNPLRKRPKLLALSLSTERQATLFQEGKIRIDLSDRLDGSLSPKARKLLFQQMRQAQDNKTANLNASSYLVLNDDATQDNAPYHKLNLQLRMALAVPSAEQAVLEIERQADDDSSRELNAALLEAAIAHGHKLAIILE